MYTAQGTFTEVYGSGTHEERTERMRSSLLNSGRDRIVTLHDSGSYLKVAHISEAGYVTLYFGFVAQDARHDVYRHFNLTRSEMEELSDSYPLSCANCGAYMSGHPYPGTCDTPSLTRTETYTLT